MAALPYVFLVVGSLCGMAWRAVIKRVTSRVGMSRAGLEHILKQLHVELGGIPPMARHLVGPHQLPTHFTLLGKSDGRMKMLIADVVLARAFGVGGVGNSVSSQFMASFRQRSGLLQLERSDAMRCDACSAQGNAAACGVKSKHSGHRLFLLVSSPLLLGGRWAVIT